MRTLVRLALCCFAAAFAAEAGAQLQGSLFTQPEEREYLDYLRLEFLRNNAEEGFNIEEADIPEIPADVVVEESAGPVLHSFGGAITRRDGSHSIWLDGALLDEAQLPEGFRVVTDNRVISLQIARDGNTYTLRPGQTVDLTAGTVSETQRVAPAPPATPPPAQTQQATAEVPVAAVPAAAVQEAPAETSISEAADATTAVSSAEASVPPAVENDAASILDDNVDGAVARLTEAEAAALEAALARRRAAAATPRADSGQESSE